MESERDRRMADEMSSYWVNFKNDLNGRGLPTGRDSRTVMHRRTSLARLRIILAQMC